MQLNPTAFNWQWPNGSRIRRLFFKGIVHGLFWPILVIAAMSGHI